MPVPYNQPGQPPPPPPTQPPLDRVPPPPGAHRVGTTTAIYPAPKTAQTQQRPGVIHQGVRVAGIGFVAMGIVTLVLLALLLGGCALIFA